MEHFIAQLLQNFPLKIIDKARWFKSRLTSLLLDVHSSKALPHQLLFWQVDKNSKWEIFHQQKFKKWIVHPYLEYYTNKTEIIIWQYHKVGMTDYIIIQQNMAPHFLNLDCKWADVEGTTSQLHWRSFFFSFHKRRPVGFCWDNLSIRVLLGDAVLVGSGRANVCFGVGQRAVAFLRLLTHSVKSLYTDVLQKSMSSCGSVVPQCFSMKLFPDLSWIF